MLAQSAFLSSAASTQLLQSAILGFDWPHSDAAVIHIRNIYGDSFRTTPPADEQACNQRHLDIMTVVLGPSVAHPESLPQIA